MAGGSRKTRNQKVKEERPAVQSGFQARENPNSLSLISDKFTGKRSQQLGISQVRPSNRKINISIVDSEDYRIKRILRHRVRNARVLYYVEHEDSRERIWVTDISFSLCEDNRTVLRDYIEQKTCHGKGANNVFRKFGELPTEEEDRYKEIGKQKEKMDIRHLDINKRQSAVCNAFEKGNNNSSAANQSKYLKTLFNLSQML